jgi:hypothetical protein
MQGISCVALPIPDHAFNEQTVFQGQLVDNLMEGRRFRAEFLHLWRRRLTRSIPGQPWFARFEEFLRPRVIQALGDALKAAKRGNALSAAQARQQDPDLLFGRILFAGVTADAFDQLSAESFDVPDLRSSSLHNGCDEPEIPRYENLRCVP